MGVVEGGEGAGDAAGEAGGKSAGDSVEGVRCC